MVQSLVKVARIFAPVFSLRERRRRKMFGGFYLAITLIADKRFFSPSERDTASMRFSEKPSDSQDANVLFR